MELLKKSHVAYVVGPSFTLHQKRLDAPTDLSKLMLVWSLMSCWRHAVCWPFKGNSGLLNLASYFLDGPCVLDSTACVAEFSVAG